MAHRARPRNSHAPLDGPLSGRASCRRRNRDDRLPRPAGVPIHTESTARRGRHAARTTRPAKPIETDPSHAIGLTDPCFKRLGERR